jgi:hypothetical protein
MKMEALNWMNEDCRIEMDEMKIAGLKWMNEDGRIEID